MTINYRNRVVWVTDVSTENKSKRALKEGKFKYINTKEN